MFVLPLRKWRNWQTHHLEGVALARAYGFKSRLPHIDRQYGPLNERPVVVLRGRYQRVTAILPTADVFVVALDALTI